MFKFLFVSLVISLCLYQVNGSMSKYILFLFFYTHAQASSVVDRGLDSRSGEIKDCNISICFFSLKHVALRRKNKDLLIF
jgi:hypothetical protein